MADLSGEPQTRGLSGRRGLPQLRRGRPCAIGAPPAAGWDATAQRQCSPGGMDRLGDGAPVEAVVRLDTRDLALARAPPGPPPERITLASLGATLHWRALRPRRTGCGRRARRLAPGPVRPDLDSGWHGLADHRSGSGLVRPWGRGLGPEGRPALGPPGARHVPGACGASTLGRLLPLEGLDALRPPAGGQPGWRPPGTNLAPHWRTESAPDLGTGWASDRPVGAAGGAIPGVSGLDLTLSADQGGGQIALSGEAPTLSLPQILRAPLTLTRMDGEVRCVVGNRRPTADRGPATGDRSRRGAHQHQPGTLPAAGRR